MAETSKEKLDLNLLSESSESRSIAPAEKPTAEKAVPSAEQVQDQDVTLQEVRGQLGIKRETQPDSEQLEQVTLYLLKHPELLPKELLAIVKMEIMRDMVSDSANEAMVKLGSVIGEAERLDPVQTFMTKSIVTSWLITHGYMMIKDKDFSSSVRKEWEDETKKKQGGLIKRIAGVISGREQKTQTELMERNEALAGMNEQAAREHERVLAENAALAEKTEAMLKDASETVASMLADGTAAAERTRAEVIQEKRTIIDEANSEAARVYREADEYNRSLSDENKRMERRLADLKLEVTKKQEIKAQLDANPTVFDAYERQHESEKETLEALINTGVENIKDKWLVGKDYKGSYEESHNSRMIEEILSDYKEMILDSLATYEEKFGSAKRAILASSIATRLKSIFREGKHFAISREFSHAQDRHVYISFKTDLLYRFLSPLSDEKNSAAEWLSAYKENFVRYDAEEIQKASTAIESFLVQKQS